MRTVTSLLIAGAALAVEPAMAQQISAAEAEQAHEVLKSFAADYALDPMALNTTFGVKLGDSWWTVTAKRREAAHPSPSGKLTFHRFGPHDVVLSKGRPSKPTWYVDISSPKLLKAIAAGEITAGTASMRSFEGDRVGISTKPMQGFEMDPGVVAEMYSVQTHFWAKGVPEITYFGRDKSLPTHGASATALGGMKDKRIAWFSIGPDEAANEDPRLEAGQVPNLLIITRGKGRAILGDREIELREGMSIFIPPYLRHVIRNPFDQPLEGILVLYGDNGDFVEGISYPQFIEDLNAFYSKYPFNKDP